ncbi:MAG: hypothetical protein ACI8RD_013334 [Bacillariaceae sp.]|jgi:hypothetical protein
MGCNIHAFAHRLTVLSMACLASTGFIFCALSGFGCSFIEIQSLPGRSVGNSNGNVFIVENNLQQAYLGVQCLTGADDVIFQGDGGDDDDRLWDISRLFLYISLALGGTTTSFAWLLSSCVRPTACRWRVLSILAACSAVFQIPIFLVFESNNCNFDITRQTCTFSTGAYLNIVSVTIWIIMTIWVQLLRVPRWDEELDAWRVNSSRNNNNGGSGSGQRGGTTIMIPTPKNANDSRDGTEETDFVASSPTQQQRSPLHHSNITRENANTTASNPYLSNTSTILCNAMEQLKGSNDEDDDDKNKNNNNIDDDDDLENQRRKQQQNESEIRRSSSFIEQITTKLTMKKSPSLLSPSSSPGCTILPPSIDLEDTSIEVAAVQDAFCVSEAKKNSFIGSWGSSMNRKRSSKSTSNILPRSLYAVNDNANNNNSTENNNKINSNDNDDQNTATAVMKSFIPRIEISSRSGKENKTSQQHYPQSLCITTNTDVVHYVDDSDNEIRSNNVGGGVMRSDRSSSTNRTAPGFKISCVYDDGTRHETHFPSMTSCCIGLAADAADNDEPHDHPVTFEVADGNNGDGDSNDVQYLVKKLRKEEKAAANRKSNRNRAPIPSFEFDKSSSLLTMGNNDDNNNTNSNCDGTANDDISEMTRGSGLVSSLSEVLDDVDLRHSSREVLDDLAKYY